MATHPSSTALAQNARRAFLEVLARDSAHAVSATVERIRNQATQAVAGDAALASKRRDLALDIQQRVAAWRQELQTRLEDQRAAWASGPTSRPDNYSRRDSGAGAAGLSLVDDNTIERDILASRLSLSISDHSSSQFNDLRARLASLEHFDDLPHNDVLRPQMLAGWALDSWLQAGLTLDQWRVAQAIVHDEIGQLAEAGYHEANRRLLEQGVLPEIDLRPFIRRTLGGGGSGGTSPTGPGGLGPAIRGGGVPTSGGATAGAAATSTGGRGGVAPVTQHAEAVLSRLNLLMSKHVSDYAGFAATAAAGTPRPASQTLTQAINQAQSGLQKRYAQQVDVDLSGPSMLEELQRNKQALKQAASTPVERATIEVVALMFQSILTDERIPASVRVWFARLQMPVLRVAVGEPDFFANIEHPARQLIDRMGSCVMGFDASATAVGDALEKEIKRVVQVVEAYPDTGRRVFQTVLTEFERFLKHYFQSENEATKKGVSLAQQVEQRETLAIQYTIELRRMLNEVPVQDGVREFLFQVWADVLATTAIKHSPASDQTKAMKRAAADLIWSASAKVSREERAEVIRRLPPLLRTLRDGMAQAGMPAAKQDEQIQILNSSLAAAFTAKSAAISNERLTHLMARLETLDEILPDAADIQLDEATVLDLSGHESADLEVVGEGGTAPTPNMIKWADELKVGSWYQLDYRNRVEPVQLAWQGMRKQLSLFVTPQGRGVLFQQHRLAAFLQAGLLVPAEDETLTTRATRKALAKLDADPQRLVN